MAMNPSVVTVASPPEICIPETLGAKQTAQETVIERKTETVHHYANSVILRHFFCFCCFCFFFLPLGVGSIFMFVFVVLSVGVSGLWSGAIICCFSWCRECVLASKLVALRVPAVNNTKRCTLCLTNKIMTNGWVFELETARFGLRVASPVRQLDWFSLRFCTGGCDEF